MTVTPTFESAGSIIADTIENRLLGVETALDIASPAPREEIATLVATAERMCYVLDAIRRPHEVHGSTTLNGEPLTSPD